MVEGNFVPDFLLAWNADSVKFVVLWDSEEHTFLHESIDTLKECNNSSTRSRASCCSILAMLTKDEQMEIESSTDRSEMDYR